LKKLQNIENKKYKNPKKNKECKNPKIAPGKRGVLPINSAKMQPTDQISTALVYSEAFKMTSGARYQRVTTYLLFLSLSLSAYVSNKNNEKFKSFFYYLLSFKLVFIVKTSR